MPNETPVLRTNPIKDGYEQCAVCEVRWPPDSLQDAPHNERVCIDTVRCNRFFKLARQQRAAMDEVK